MAVGVTERAEPNASRLPTLRRFVPATRRGVWWPAIAVFATLRLVAVVGLEPLRQPDSSSYEAGVSLLGPSARLWVVPALYRLVPADGGRVLIQALIAIVCWSMLAGAVARTVDRPALQKVALCTTLAIGLTVQVTQWDLAILSESLAISFSALVVASALTYTASPSWRSGTLLVASMVLWTFTRQSHVFALALIVAGLAISLLARPGRRRRAAVLAAFAVVALWGSVSLRGNAQFTYNSLGVIGSRIYTDQSATTYFERRGMPTNARSVAEAGPFTGSLSGLFDDDELVTWVEREWKREYPIYLARRVGPSLRDPLEDAPDLLSTNPSYARPRAVLPAPVSELVYGTQAGDLALWWVVGGALLIGSLAIRPRASTTIAVAVTVGAGAMYFITWHLSATELPRLELVPAVGLRIGIVLCVFAGLEDVVPRGRHGGLEP